MSPAGWTVAGFDAAPAAPPDAPAAADFSSATAIRQAVRAETRAAGMIQRRESVTAAPVTVRVRLITKIARTTTAPMYTRTWIAARKYAPRVT